MAVVRSRKVIPYRYWVLQGMAEYEKMYNKTVLQELWDMGTREGEEVERLVTKVMNSSREKECRFKSCNNSRPLSN